MRRVRSAWLGVSLGLMTAASLACGGGSTAEPSRPSPTAVGQESNPLAPPPSPSPWPTIEASPSPFPGPWSGDEVIDVRGSDAFVTQTRAALKLLSERAPDAYEKILAYVGVIEQGQHSGMWAFENPPRYEVGDPTAFSTLTWYASTIAHDATHSELYYNYRSTHPGEPVPQEAWADVRSERFCIAYQLFVATRIGAPVSETEYLAGLTGDHCDVDHDGDCDWDDYYARDW